MHALPTEVRLYDHLFLESDQDATHTHASRGRNMSAKAEPARQNDPESPPESTGGTPDWKANLNPKSLEVRTTCFVEPSLRTAQPGDRVQFARQATFP